MNDGPGGQRRRTQATGNTDDQNTANALFWSQWVHPESCLVSLADAPFPLALDAKCDLFYCHCERRLAYLLFSMAYSPTSANTFPIGRTLAFTDGRIVRKVRPRTCDKRERGLAQARMSCSHMPAVSDRHTSGPYREENVPHTCRCVRPRTRCLEVRDSPHPPPVSTYPQHSDKPLGVVHGIWNTNMNAICEYLGYPFDPDFHKEVSQADIRIIARIVRFVFVWPCGFLWLLGLLGRLTGA
eukprot:4841397-Prymnesium_polylepis.1